MATKSNEDKESRLAQPKMLILNQFIKDMSFENFAAQKGVNEKQNTPEINVQVNIEAKKRTPLDEYDVIIKTKISSKNKSNEESLFLLELEYGGIFQISNVPEDQLHPYLLIECPRMLFPYLRRIIGDITRDGGYPPLNLESIDFLALYQAEIKRHSKVPDRPN